MKMHKQKHKKVKSYFQITEDPPHALPNLRKTNRSIYSYKLPNNSFFFIDFTEHCQLRLMRKTARQENQVQPLEIQKFGKNIIINVQDTLQVIVCEVISIYLSNVQDSSPLENQLVKYEEQHRNLNEKRFYIDSKIKEQLSKNRNKFRSKSVMMIRQETLEEYNKPIKLKKKSAVLPTVDLQSTKELNRALKKLGLFRE